MQPKQIIFVFLVFVLIACGPAPSTPEQTSVETIVAGTLQALTPTAEPATATPAGTTFTSNNISFVIPPNVALSVKEELIEGVQPTEFIPWWEVHPAHQQHTLEGYIFPDTFHTPKIYLYPVADFVAINESVAQGIESLKSIIATPNQTLPEELPFLPTFNAAQIFYSNVGVVNFQNGSGIRYITQFGQAPLPINNHEVFYTFQGITSDGLYYVSAILPIHASFLAEYGSPEYPVPADGIPFDWENWENIDVHVSAVKDKLNATSPEAFSPSLLVFDSFINSILVTGNP